MLMEELQEVPTVAIVNKSDLQTVADLDYIKEKFSHVVFISAISGDGLKQLEDLLLCASNCKIKSSLTAFYPQSVNAMLRSRQKNL